MKIIITILGCLGIFWPAVAQDSSKTLSPETFFAAVQLYHPLAKQAGLQPKIARAQLLSARDGFDPQLQIDGGSKTLDGLRYYQYDGGSVKIPTWYGIELEAGLKYLGGNKINPEETVGRNSYAGIRIPIAKNLLMDKRRAVLLQAKIASEAAEPEKQKMLNDLLMEAAEAYWQWVLASLNYETCNRVLEANKKRKELISTAYRAGDRAAIDTTEALLQYQQIVFLQTDAQLAKQNAAAQLSNFLWTAAGEPYLLPDTIEPGISWNQLTEAANFPEIEQLLASARESHPELKLYQFKIKSLGVEKKLKFQELLPKVDLKYNQLGKGYNLAPALAKTYFDNNYRWGISVSVPLRLSKGRGEYRAARLKIEETRLQQEWKTVSITNKVQQYYQQLKNYQVQLELASRLYEQYQRMQRAEEIKFFNGESSLFLVNSRETKTLEAQLKLTETAVKYNKTKVALRWATGELPGR